MFVRDVVRLKQDGKSECQMVVVLKCGEGGIEIIRSATNGEHVYLETKVKGKRNSYEAVS